MTGKTDCSCMRNCPRHGDCAACEAHHARKPHLGKPYCRKEKEEQKKRERERRMQEALLTIKKKYGKNAVLRGMNFEEGATAKERNGQIGGHQA